MRTKARAIVGSLVALGVVVAFGVFVAGSGASSEAVPTNSTPPTISGTPNQGATLTVNPGSWNGGGSISYDYQWLRCDGVGGSCSAIIGQTSATYVLTSIDVSATVRATVTATNADGNASATTIPTAVITIAPAAPSHTSAATISGAAQQGQALLAGPGNWNGTAPITFSYRWLRCDGSGNRCGYITNPSAVASYLVAAADVGSTLRVEVTGTNAVGHSASTSAQTAVVATPAVPSGCAKEGGAIPVTGVTPPARLTIDRLQSTPSTINFGTTTFTARFHVTACGGSVQGALVYATATPYNQFTIPKEVATDAGGWATLQFSRLSGFPATSKQRLLVMFVRARKSGENVLGGISTRRLISFRVTR
ncbi:MAG TPA: hypothetical protein VF094_09370 [Gaiellaceae bacterium]